MLKKIIGSFLINFSALYIAAQFVSALHLPTGLKELAILILAFTAIHLFIKPLLNIFLKALNFLTLGIIGLIVDAIILYLLSTHFPDLRISDWQFLGTSVFGLNVPSHNFSSIETTLISAFIINLIRTVLLTIFF